MKQVQTGAHKSRSSMKQTSGIEWTGLPLAFFHGQPGTEHPQQPTEILQDMSGNRNGHDGPYIEVLMNGNVNTMTNRPIINMNINDSINNNNISNDDISSLSPPTQQTTRKSKNLKNLHLNLNSLNKVSAVDSMNIPSPRQLEDDINNIRLQSPPTFGSFSSTTSSTSLSSSPTTTQQQQQPPPISLIRSPSLFRRVQTTPPSSTQANSQRKRSTTLALTIPPSSSSSSPTTTSTTTIAETGKIPTSIKPHLSSASSISTIIMNGQTHNDLQTPVNNKIPIPILPFERPVRKRTNSSTGSNCTSSSRSSTSPTLSYSSEIKSQTIMHSFSEPNPNDESYKIAYSNGPICVLEPNLYLYAEPTLKEVTDFQVIINVAQEITDFSQDVDQYNKLNNYDNVEYYFIPWTHTSKLTIDFPKLTNIIDDSLKANKKVLIHCQCGVSRSASLVMAYFMKISKTGYNEAYSKLKNIVPQISPNLSLIYELIEWGEQIENNNSNNNNNSNI